MNAFLSFGDSFVGCGSLGLENLIITENRINLPFFMYTVHHSCRHYMIFIGYNREF